MKLLRVSLIGLVVVVLLSGSPAMAAVDPWQKGPHSGKQGRHLLVDDAGSPGADCKYGGQGQLLSITGRPPIAYAYDKTDGVDSGEVGYRVILESSSGPTTSVYEDWEDVAVSGYTQDGTTDKENVNWPSRKVLRLPAGSDLSKSYRMSMQFRWSTGHYANTIGLGIHVVGFYAVVPSGGLYTQSCPGQKTATSSAVQTASGKTGPNVLFDNEEYPGVTCTYGTAPNFLTSLKVSAPIVLAYNRTSQRDVQWVRWRFRIEYTDVDPVLADWHGEFTSSWKKARASDNFNALWDPRTWTRGDNPLRGRYRAIVDMRWNYPTKTRVNGRTTKLPGWYLSVEGATQSKTQDSCSGTTG